MLPQPRTPAMVVLLLALAGCTASPDATPDRTRAARPAPPGGGLTLTGELKSPVDAILRWKGDEPGAAGRVLEFATEPTGPYTVLEFLAPGRTEYEHPDLMPHTPFFYRLRPYSGPASAPVEVTLPPGEPTAEDQEDDHTWTAPRTVDGPPADTHPVVDAPAGGETSAGGSTQPADAAAPGDLRATVMHAAGIGFTWTDHAEDEDGFLLETRPSGSETYRPVAVLDPDINSFGLITLPDEKTASYRVRAFVYGEQSNIVHLETGAGGR
ncbi:fibronectin type III domain-containing protein [Streptomyces sp. NBC_01317]|uniref:fibronectin type III domain-containing protein n=1 Tax=Streptomyces sp. NBC_01317 TaxID=2903822 RepID=UPI002E1232BE|nr:fibronectin type III domain-containing protein [Streptomyces sp. NBC_01317]